MSNQLPVVALIGRANAGKSSLFNRLVGQKQAIVAREPGTTRDSVIGTVFLHKAEGSKTTRHDKPGFILVDTAGLKNPDDDFEMTIQDQVADAIAGADAILYVVDSTEYPSQQDQEFAHKILASKKPVILLLNKSDLKTALPEEEFRRFAIKTVIRTSAEHNQGIIELINELKTSLSSFANEGHRNDTEESRTSRGILGDGNLKIALIGRPNSGKSTLFNAMGQKQQAITSDRAGTTRDINRLNIKFKNQDIEILDTAGIRRSGRIEVGIEKFSVLRTLAAIEESDICLLTMDVGELNTALDQKLAGLITEAGKGIIIVITKWDTLEEEKTNEILTSISNDFDFVPYTPLIFTSSITGKNITKIFDLALEINTRRHQKISTRELNKILSKATAAHPPAGLKNTHPKFRYIVQTDVAPPWFVIYGAHFKFIHWSYLRYLERQFRENLDLTGTPIRFSFRDEKQIQANKERLSK